MKQFFILAVIDSLRNTADSLKKQDTYLGGLFPNKEEIAHSIFENILWVIIAALFTWIGTLMAKWQFRKSNLTGTWEQIVVDDNGTIVKKDIIKLTQDRQKIEATSKRIFPENQQAKEWKFEGRCENRHLYGYYFSKSGNHLSCGTINLIIVNDTELSGFYHKTSLAKLSESSGTTKIQQEFAKKINIQWKKI